MRGMDFGKYFVALPALCRWAKDLIAKRRSGTGPVDSLRMKSSRTCAGSFGADENATTERRATLLALERAHRQCHVLTTKAKRVVEGHTHFGFAGLIGHVVQVAQRVSVF